MELVQAIEKRRTIRKFKAEPVDAALLQELVRRAALAPSVNNTLPWKFIAVTNPEVIRQLGAAVHGRVQSLFATVPNENVVKTVEYFSTLFEDAPAVLFVAAQPYTAIADQMEGGISHEFINVLRRQPDMQSVGAAVQNVLLSAVELGLGACWLSGLMVARTELEAMLKLEKPWELVTAVALGKPAAEPRPREEASMAEIFTHIA